MIQDIVSDEEVHKAPRRRRSGKAGAAARGKKRLEAKSETERRKLENKTEMNPNTSKKKLQKASGRTAGEDGGMGKEERPAEAKRRTGPRRRPPLCQRPRYDPHRFRP
jgi:hypothetical protein